MQGQLYQVSYLGASYYAVPVYYPGSVVFQSWYLIAYVNGMLVPYTIVPGNTVVVLYNPYLGTPAPSTPGTPPAPSPSPSAGVLALNGLTGILTIAGGGGIVVSQSVTTLTLTGGGGSSTGLTQAQADALYAPLPTSATPGIPSPSPGDPLPQYVLGSEILGSTYKEQTTSPTSPVVGQLWKNTSGSTVAGIPSGNYGYWNGTEWVDLGGRPFITQNDVFGAGYKEQATAPTSPTTGQIWQNTSGSTVAGVPAGNYAVWNGTAWVPAGTIAPFLTAANGVTSLNTLVGAINLVAGNNTAIVTTGQNLSVNAITGFASDTAPSSPYPGQVWYNSFSGTVSGIPSGRFAVWNGSAWINVGTRSPEGTLVVSASAPTAPVQGQTWLNILGSTLSGVPSGSHGVWNGTAWVNVGTSPPSTVQAGSSKTGFMIKSSADILIPGVGPGTFTLLRTATGFDTKLYDAYGSFNLTTGQYVVTGQQGTWIWNIGCAIPWNTSSQASNVYVTKNSTTVNYGAGLSINAYYAAVNVRPLELSNGDILRFYIESPFDDKTVQAGALIYGSRDTQIS